MKRHVQMLSSSSQKQSKKHSWTIKQSRQQFSECTSMIASLGYFTSPALLLTLPELIPCDTSCKRIFNLTANFNFEGMWCFCATGHWWRQQSREVRFSKSFTPCILCHWQCKESSGGCVSRSRLMCWCIGFSLMIWIVNPCWSSTESPKWGRENRVVVYSP